ncbi:Iaa7p [Sarracenia purpurea var. burkii]
MEVDRKMSNLLIQERDHGYSLNLKATELCLGFLGGGGAKVVDEVNITGKRWFSETIDLKLNLQPNESVVLKENMNSSQKNLRPCPKDPAKPRWWWRGEKERRRWRMMRERERESRW